MNQKQAKRLRKYIKKNIDELLFSIRNEVGDATEKMDERAIYQYAKNMYYKGKLVLK